MLSIKKMNVGLSVLFLFLLFSIKLVAQGKPETTNVKVIRDTIYQDKDDILADYRKEMTDDMNAHREYLNSYYEKLYNTALGWAAVIGAILVFLGVRTFKEAKELMIARLKEQMDPRLSKRLDEEIEKILAAKGYEDHNKELQIELQRMYRQFESVVPLYVNLFNQTTLTYLTPSGSDVQVAIKGRVASINEHETLNAVTHVMSVAKPGTVDLLSTNLTYRLIENLPHKKDLKLFFPEPVTKDREGQLETCWSIKNSFTGKNEWYEIFQMNPVRREQVTLKFQKTRKPSKPEIFRVHNDNELQPIVLDILEQVDQATLSYIIELPVDIIPAKYKITWNF